MTIEKVTSEGPDVVIAGGGADATVGASETETSAIADWLAADAGNTFSVDAQ